MSKIEIKLTKGNVPHLASEPITGNVVFSLSSAKSAKSVEIKLKGTVETRWKENEDRSYHYFDKILETKLTLWKPSDGKGELPAGSYNFPFSFVIPSDSPTPPSFDGPYGHIRYLLTAKFDRPGIKIDDKARLPITIFPRVDTNAMAVERVSASIEKTLCCCCCADGPIKVSVDTPRKAFSPGDQFDIKVDIDNNSKKVLDGFVLQVSEIVTYRAGFKLCQKTYSTKNVEVVAQKEPINPNSTFTKTLNVIIPPTVPSFPLSVGKAIEVRHELRAYLLLSGPHVATFAPVQVLVGTVPSHAAQSTSSSSSSSAAPAVAAAAPAKDASVPASAPGDAALPADNNSEPDYITKMTQQMLGDPVGGPAATTTTTTTTTSDVSSFDSYGIGAGSKKDKRKRDSGGAGDAGADEWTSMYGY